MSQQKILFEKIWDAHVVAQEVDSPPVLYIDLHLVHEVTSPQAFSGLKSRGLKARRPDQTIATADHGIPTLPANKGDTEGRMALADDQCRRQISLLEENCQVHGIRYYGRVGALIGRPRVCSHTPVRCAPGRGNCIP